MCGTFAATAEVLDSWLPPLSQLHPLSCFRKFRLPVARPAVQLRLLNPVQNNKSRWLPKASRESAVPQNFRTFGFHVVAYIGLTEGISSITFFPANAASYGWKYCWSQPLKMTWAWIRLSVPTIWWKSSCICTCSWGGHIFESHFAFQQGQAAQ